MPSNLLGTTLLDMAAIEKRPMARAIIRAMFTATLPSPIDTIPVVNALALSQQIVRLSDAGAPSTRNIGQAVTAYAAKFVDATETLKIIENKITIDKVLLDVKTYIQDPIKLQTDQYAQTVKLLMNELLIAGDPGTDVTQPAGLDYRLRNQALFVGQSVNAAGLNVDNSDANRNEWLDKMSEAVDLARAQADICIVNRQTYQALRSALRNLKLYDTTKDQFDRQVMVYDGVRFYDAGQKPAGALQSSATNQIIGDDNATSIFNTGSTTPMYFLSTKGEQGVKVLQLHPLRVTKPGIDASDPGVFVIDVTWPIGFLVPHKFAISSVQGLDIT